VQALFLCIIKYSYLGIFIALGLGILGLPIPDETLMAYAGFLIFQGKLNYFYTVIVAFAGTLCGITIGYILGRRFGYPFIERYSDKMRVNYDHVRKSEEFYRKYGKFALFVGYFIPGVRHLTSIFAGVSLMPYRTFAFFSYLGGLLWTITFVSFGFVMGDKWRKVSIYSERYIIPVVLVSILILLIAIYWRSMDEKKSYNRDKTDDTHPLP